MKRIHIVAARRTPFGRMGGKLADLSPIQLAAHAANATLAGIDLAKIDSVIIGNVLAAGHGMNLARQIAISAAVPIQVPAFTINMMCGSGMQAALLGAQAIRNDECRAVLVGGVESMSLAPYLIPRPSKNQQPTADRAIDSLLQDGLIDSFSHRHMGQTAEDLAVEYSISRLAQDAFAERSQRLTAQAQAFHEFALQLISLSELKQDEHPRPNVTCESLSNLKPLFRESGTITAGNASGVNDGAALLLLAEAEFATQQGWPSLCEWVDGVVVGCDPQKMGLGPVHAIRKLLNRQQCSLAEIDHLEINEAFAAQVLACAKVLEIEIGMSETAVWKSGAVRHPIRFNPQGGAIALGHPLAASGARLLTHLAWQIQSGQSKNAIAALCIGGGMGIAAMLRTIQPAT